ncbi:recombinase family protein [Ruegeria conchae]|uniref:DNA invertase Pin-like site-specific DNA recombinase n=1 Tax=Ruegeria conchae TaxID=981384 RepID=A0A497ZYD9_9RHOB|nr:recombinase family protein [Ruegeria conchae]RLK10635.1 DNA invertase Pin-like site-specific DNA recombinase [Ruegeria conchae]
MIIGYARTSTLEQQAGLEAQLEALTEVGCEKIYSEQVSSVARRGALSEALSFCREGDVLIVTKLDRLARSVRHLGEIVDELTKRGIALRVLDMSLDTSTATGKLMLNVLGSIAQFEREMMLERQREGIAKAKAEGKYKGRKPTARMRTAEVLQLLGQGYKKHEIAQRLRISQRSVYRIVNEAHRSVAVECNR